MAWNIRWTSKGYWRWLDDALPAALRLRARPKPKELADAGSQAAQPESGSSSPILPVLSMLETKRAKSRDSGILALPSHFPDHLRKGATKLTMTNIHGHAIELVLESIQNEVGDDGMMHSFFYSKPGERTFGLLGSMGTEIFYSEKRITLAALYVRRHGPAYLRDLPVSGILSLLMEFVQQNFWYISDETFCDFSGGTYSSKVSKRTKMKLADLLASSSIFTPASQLTLFPLVTVSVEAAFASPSFFVKQPSRLLEEFEDNLHSRVEPNSFPPIKEARVRKETPASWLGVRSPNEKAAEKTKAAILGALSLTIADRQRYTFSGRHMWGGICTFDGTVSYRLSTAHTPALMYNIQVRATDQSWLEILAAKIGSGDAADDRHLRGLEYFFRAWGLPPHERYPLHCMALEAVFGEKNNHTQAVKNGIRATLGAHISPDRIGDLLKVRGAVVHGQAPDVYDAEEYDAYYNTYSEDPIVDLAVLTAAALRQHLFGGTMTDQPEPHQDLLEKAAASGRIPKNFRRGHGILEKPASSSGVP